MAAEQEINIKFVQEVEKHACLYNYKLPEYMRKNTIDRTWAEIGNKFQIQGSEAKEKWKNLRSVFVRHLKPPKSGAGTAQKKPYYLADFMQFTIPFIKTAGKPSGNLNETIEDNDTLQPQSPELCEQTQFTESVPTSTQSISQQQSSLPSTSTQSISQQHSSFPPTSTQSILRHQLPPATSNKRKRKKLEETQAEQDIAAYFKLKRSKIIENCDSTENSNKMFLLSLLSDVNKLNDNQRRLFKRRVLELIDDIMDQSSPITLLSTPSPTDRAISTPNTINESVQSNTATLYYESIPMFLSQEDEE
ncbi:unnamed protein product [Parnassius mnemosyne]|uniref:Transcription factor Adf-1 n=1 Tax=Parnassius mnemosyne TaxID=213953 RepID=A0AAV1KZE7_9NEOP